MACNESQPLSKATRPIPSLAAPIRPDRPPRLHLSADKTAEPLSVGDLEYRVCLGMFPSAKYVRYPGKACHFQSFNIS